MPQDNDGHLHLGSKRSQTATLKIESDPGTQLLASYSPHVDEQGVLCSADQHLVPGAGFPEGTAPAGLSLFP